MGYFRTNVLFLVVLFFSAASFGAFIGEREHSLDRAFIPTGFDADDAVQVFVSGMFEKPCLQIGWVSSEVDSERGEILIQVMTYEYTGRCLEPGMRFHQVVHLGRIRRSGGYALIDKVSRRKLGELVIDPAPAEGVGTDSRTYAPLTDAFLVQIKGQQYLGLRGIRSAYCGEITNIDFRSYADVLVVLPEYRQRPGRCGAPVRSFERLIPVPVKLPKFPFLLHVRSAAGQAISKMNY